MKGIKLRCAGEQGLIVDFGNVISLAINAKVSRLARRLAEADLPAVREIVPTYRSLYVSFDPLQLSRCELEKSIRSILATEVEGVVEEPVHVVHIPACYGGEFGPDLDFVATHAGMTSAEVIAIHSSVSYRVYMLGFTPGFPYLGGMSAAIATPRLDIPRTVIPAGSVGIAGAQTGFYPIASPGGWRLIARTPLQAFDPTAANPFLFRAGDYLRFVPVSTTEYAAIQAEVVAGSYVVKSEWLEREGGGVV